jgi:Fe-S-cluster containining protein
VWNRSKLVVQPMNERHSSNPCLQCGACCATFRVSFYWSDATVWGLPESLTERVNPWLSCMAGTNQPAPRCRALEGVVGKEVTCVVYSQRPSPCREVQPGDEKCSKARVAHGLAPLGIGWPAEAPTTPAGPVSVILTSLSPLQQAHQP